jgi:signal transduction histidine kinase/CheY-like chemotaxis protein
MERVLDAGARNGSRMKRRKMGLGRNFAGRIGRLSFRSKMGLATIAACAATVLIACLAFMVNEALTYRIRFDREQKTLSEVLAANVTAAVLFGDDASARDILSATRLTPQVDAAVVYTPDGAVFAAFRAAGTQDAAAADVAAAFASHRGPVFKSVVKIDEEVIGELVLFTNLSELERTMWRYALIASLVFLGSTLFAILLARWESQAMATPMLQLRHTIQSIRETRDYSSRVPSSLDRDFGRLIDNFNAMLEEIESRDERLESLVGDLISARDAAQSANTSKSQFLANMSHELRTPLNAIINYAEIIQEDLAETGGDETIADVGKIQSAGLHLLSLINGILDLSKIEAGKMEVEAHTFDVATVIREACDTVRPAAERSGNRLVVSIAPDLDIATTDSLKFRQCVLNLLSNACKFTSNGEVRLTADLQVENGREHIRVEIADTGIGMNETQMKSLFKAFVQADASTTRKYGGTGLGLAITQRLVTLMGGRVDVDSAPGVGSRFSFSIPRRLGEDVEAEKPPAQAKAPASARADASRTALIVDDDPNARELMGRLAARLNYKTLLAPNGEEAMKIAREQRPSVILLDLHMPVVDGWTVLQRLRADADLCAIPTIVVSVDDDAKACYRLGAEDFLTKPLNRLELERALLSYTQVASGKILIVEDNDDAAALVARAATNVGFEARIAPTAEAALDILRRETFIGIILDLGLPGMSGFEFLNALRDGSAWRDMPVIVFSAQELTSGEIAAIETMAQGYHPKGATSPRAVVSEFMARSGSPPADAGRAALEKRQCAS